MRIKNFRNFRIHKEGTSREYYTATIDAKPLFKKYEPKNILRELAGTWHFIDNGKFVFHSIETLERSYKAKLAIFNCK